MAILSLSEKNTARWTEAARAVGSCLPAALEKAGEKEGRQHD